jgi:hypothetical protein
MTINKAIQQSFRIDLDAGFIRGQKNDANKAMIPVPPVMDACWRVLFSALIRTRKVRKMDNGRMT